MTVSSNFEARRVGTQKGGGPKGEGPKSGEPKRWRPEGWRARRNGGPKEWSPEGGGPEGWGPSEGWGGLNFRVLFPLPPIFALVFSLSGGSCGTVATGHDHGQPNLCVWVWGHFVRAPAPYRPPGFHKIAQTRNLGGHGRDPWPQFHGNTSRERKIERKWGGRGKKARNFVRFGEGGPREGGVHGEGGPGQGGPGEGVVRFGRNLGKKRFGMKPFWMKPFWDENVIG